MKKILSIIMVAVLLISVATVFTACTGGEDEAKQLALSEARKFASGLSSCSYQSASVTNIKRSGGKFIVDVDLKIGMEVYTIEVDVTQPITYTISVSGGTAKVKDVVYHDFRY